MIKLRTILTEATKQFPREHTDKLFKALKLDTTNVSPEQFFMGMNVELEHIDVIEGNIKKLALLVLAHLKEDPEYYTKLQAVEYQSDLGDDDVPPTTGMYS